jgi:hypothetical protein
MGGEIDENDLLVIWVYFIERVSFRDKIILFLKELFRNVSHKEFLQ